VLVFFADYMLITYWRLRKSPISALYAISQNLRLTPCKHTRTPGTLHSSKTGKPWSWTFTKPSDHDYLRVHHILAGILSTQLTDVFLKSPIFIPANAALIGFAQALIMNFLLLPCVDTRDYLCDIVQFMRNRKRRELMDMQITRFPGLWGCREPAWRLCCSPISSLRAIPDEFHVRQVRCILRNPAILDLKLFVKPSVRDFLRAHQSWVRFRQKWPVAGQMRTEKHYWYNL